MGGKPQKPKVQAYIDQRWFDAFETYRQERNLNASQALGSILAQFFGSGQSLPTESAEAPTSPLDLATHLEPITNRIETLERRIESIERNSAIESAVRLAVDSAATSEMNAVLEGVELLKKLLSESAITLNGLAANPASNSVIPSNESVVPLDGLAAASANESAIPQTESAVDSSESVPTVDESATELDGLATESAMSLDESAVNISLDSAILDPEVPLPDEFVTNPAPATPQGNKLDDQVSAMLAEGLTEIEAQLESGVTLQQEAAPLPIQVESAPSDLDATTVEDFIDPPAPSVAPSQQNGGSNDQDAQAKIAKFVESLSPEDLIRWKEAEKEFKEILDEIDNPKPAISNVVAKPKPVPRKKKASRVQPVPSQNHLPDQETIKRVMQSSAEVEKYLAEYAASKEKKIDPHPERRIDYQDMLERLKRFG